MNEITNSYLSSNPNRIVSDIPSAFLCSALLFSVLRNKADCNLCIKTNNLYVIKSYKIYPQSLCS